MAKKQSRRSISVNRSLYEICKAAAEQQGVPLAQFTELALRRHLAPAAIAAVSAPHPDAVVEDIARRADEILPGIGKLIRHRREADKVAEFRKGVGA